MKMPNMRPVDRHELPDERYWPRDILQALVGGAAGVSLILLDPSWWMKIAALALTAVVLIAIDRLMPKRRKRERTM